MTDMEHASDIGAATFSGRRPTMDGKRIRAFYANATAWSFDGDAEPHVVAMREKQGAEFDRWLAGVKADAWDEGHSWGWSDAQESHDVRQHMTRADWPLCTPNPYESEEDRHVDQ